MKKSLLIHPFLFAIFPIVFLFAHNINQVRFADTVFSLIIVVSCSAALLFLLRLFFRSSLKAAVLLSIFWILFFSYGHLYQVATQWRFSGFEVGEHEHLLPFFGLLLIFSSFLIFRTEKKLDNLCRILNVIAVSLVAMSLINIGLYRLKELSADKTVRRDESALAAAAAKASGAFPDIYCIILDEYAGLNQIKQIYNYDNSAFVDRLVKKGFYVAERSRTNMPFSSLSLFELLNMRLPRKEENLYAMIHENAVVKFLKSQGYQYLHFGSWWSGTIRSRYADFNFSDWMFESEFFIVLASTSMLRPLFYSGTLSGRGRVLYQFEKLAQVPDMDVGAPKFVFAHIICPHPPFVFGPNGEKLKFKDRTDWQNRSLYLGQYIFITKKAEELIEAILSKSRKPPIIVLQSDHGVKKIPGFDVGDNRRIFNAYYLPGFNKRLLYPSITPRNTFRFIFNRYFGTDLDLWPDE